MFSFDTERQTWAIRVTWEPEAKPDGWYIIERIKGGHGATQYGPTYYELIEPLIEERRQYFLSLRDSMCAHLMPSQFDDIALG